jgi:hypothetical protein
MESFGIVFGDFSRVSNVKIIVRIHTIFRPMQKAAKNAFPLTYLLTGKTNET